MRTHRYRSVPDAGELPDRDDRIVEQQASGRPISEWTLAEYCVEQDWRDSYQTIGQFMTQDLFTVRPDDIVDFAASLMDWRHVRHVPVVDAYLARLAALVRPHVGVITNIQPAISSFDLPERSRWPVSSSGQPRATSRRTPSP